VPTQKSTKPKPATKATKRASRAAATKAPAKQSKPRAPRKHPASAAATAATEQAAPPNWLVAARAADSKKATKLRVLDLREITSFADFFFICSGANQRQIQTIANEIETELKKHGERPNAVEGYGNAEWVLMDYGDLVVHIFSDQARAYYDLDRLWRDGKEVPITL
jgi:ribosome-associated protein